MLLEQSRAQVVPLNVAAAATVGISNSRDRLVMQSARLPSSGVLASDFHEHFVKTSGKEIRNTRHPSQASVYRDHARS